MIGGGTAFYLPDETREWLGCFLSLDELPYPCETERSFSMNIITHDHTSEALEQSCGLVFSCMARNSFRQTDPIGGLYEVRYVLGDSLWAERFLEQGCDWLVENRSMVE